MNHIKGGFAMSEIARISSAETRQKVLTGKALLVCAYPVYEKFLRFQLDGAIPLSDLQAKESSLAGDQEIIFY
jgi:hypothetical protein